MELSRMKLGPATAYALAVANGYKGTLEEWLKEQRGPAGTTPHIGENGNWYIGEADTGVKAAGSDGKTPIIGENGNWWIGNEDTGIAAEGKAATIEITGTETLEAGRDAAVEEADGSTPQARKYTIKVPKGAAGEAATVELTGIETLEPGKAATLTELEDSTTAHRRYKIGVPQGKQGEPGKDGIYPIIAMTDATAELAPNTYYKWGEIAALSITLADPADTTITNEYCFEFVSGETATELTVPSNIKWVQTPSIEAGKTYQVSIVNGIGCVAGA